MTSTNSLAIYVSSYDGAADTWAPFFAYFFRHWPECPYPIYLGVNEKTWDDARFINLRAPPKLSWSHHTRVHLEQIPHEYVLFTLDDFFLCKDVDGALIENLLKHMDVLDLTSIRLVTDVPPTKSISGAPLIGMFPPWQQLRTSCSPTIWRRKDLLALMRDEENIWHFEVNSAIRSHRYSGVCGTWEKAWHHHHAIAQGKWFPWIIRTMKQDGIMADTSQRPHHTHVSAWRDVLNVNVWAKLRKIIPHRIRQKLTPLIYGKGHGF